MENEDEVLKQELGKEWGIELAGIVSEQEILDKLALQIASIAEKGADAFFQLMYRLDIPEKQLINTIYDKDVAMKVAKLVYTRQLQKIRSRQHYKSKPTDDKDITW